MYSMNLSWNVPNEILEILTKGGFVRVESEGKRRFRITRKGSRALSYHRKLIEGFHPAIELYGTI
jgi:predicted transcriptional regulator